MANHEPPPDPACASTGFTRWPWYRRWFGRRSERAAARYLRKQGYRIVAANLADTRGEIDLIAIDGQTIVVVEVRSSESDNIEKLALSVDRDKQRRLTDAALRFLQRRRLLNVSVRFDVLAICWPPKKRRPIVKHYRNAFEAVGRFQMYS
jgi:putative endonuclease